MVVFFALRFSSADSMADTRNVYPFIVKADQPCVLWLGNPNTVGLP